ncbi:MAG: hypothetical protein KAT77_04195 [Nanoarchaeota archaeon]|nr:hypothetical protein [Nanoarchaeota archaeon]
MKKTHYLVSGTIFFLLLVFGGMWCTLSNDGSNRITGQFIGWNALSNFIVPWIGVLAFVIFVIILNLKKFK